MRLLFLIHSMSLGGAERVTANLANHWAKKGWKVAVATLTSADTDFYQLHPQVERIPLKVAAASPNILAALHNNLRCLHAVRRLLKAWRPEVAIGMMTTASVYLALARTGMPVCCIGSERVHPPQMPLGKAWEKLRAFSYGRLDALVTLTQQSADWLKEHTSAQRGTVIPNAVPWPLPKQEPVVNPGQFFDTGRKICLAVGRLSHQKGFDLLLRAFAAIAPKVPMWDLAIVGEGPLRADLEQQAIDLGIEHRVKFPGRVGNVSDWYKAADLYVMSSRFEGFPNTLAEAMACGCPAISFDCETGPADIIRHQVDGLLVPNGDVADLARTLEQLMSDEILRLKYRTSAIEARNRFSMEKIAAMWERLFAELRYG